MALSRINADSIADGTIVAAEIADGAISNTKLATGSVENYIASTGRPLTNRNLIINGAMQVAQRNTSVTGITTTGYYTADRWHFVFSSAGTWTMNVESSGPTNTEFKSSANVICTTADSSLSASDFSNFAQRLEGQNVQGIKKGTSAAESLTVSFWVKSSNTGTYICEFFDVDNNRQISKSYTIDTANTWEKKTITVPPDTTGQLDNDNANSLRLNFWLAAGTTFTSGTLNDSAWATSVNANRLVGQLNLANLSGNYWAVTGIQLETGEVATPFEMRSYGQELALCQRYYYSHAKGLSANAGIATGAFYTASDARATVFFPVSMRIGPSIVSSNDTNHYRWQFNNTSVYSNTVATPGGGITTTCATIYSGSGEGLSGGTAGYAINVVTGTADTVLAFNAEL